MGDARATEKVTQHWVRCSEDDFGAFIDWLESLTADARNRYETDWTAPTQRMLTARRSAADKGTAAQWELDGIPKLEAEIEADRRKAGERFRPEWDVTVGKRTLTASGSWEDVGDAIPIARSRVTRITVGRFLDSPYFVVTAARLSGLSVATTGPSAAWMDEHMPQIRSRMRSLAPSFGWLPRPVVVVVFVLTWLALTGFNLVSILVPASSSWTAFTGLALLPFLFAGLVAMWIPSFRVGRASPSWWMSAAKWVVLAVAAGVIGALVARALGLS